MSFPGFNSTLDIQSGNKEYMDGCGAFRGMKQMFGAAVCFYFYFFWDCLRIKSC